MAATVVHLARSELQPGGEIQSYGPDQFIATRK